MSEAARDMDQPWIDTGDFDAAVFDLDGVVTRTARIHFTSWKRLFDSWLRARSGRTGEPFREFTYEDYRRYVDGLPRYDGVAAFLTSRGIELPWGNPADPPERATVCGLGNRKNAFFEEVLDSEGVGVFEASVALIRCLRRAGLKTALVSSSRNARAVLERAHLTDLFDVIVDGNDATRLELKGKPEPDIFLAATERLGVPARRALMVEDALSGVAAGDAGGFRMVIGVDRANRPAALREAGADVVVADLGELSVRRSAIDNGPRGRTVRMEEIAQLIKNRQPAIFLDYDGTLTPIVARPDLATLSDEMRAAVRRLAALCTVAIVSGRDRGDVERLVDLKGLIYAGSHGFDISGPGGLRIEHEKGSDFTAAVGRATDALKATLSRIPGALVEPKRFAVAVHYRLVTDSYFPAVEAAVDRVLEEIPELCKMDGKKVFELRPRFDWDKGKAVLWLLHALGLERPEVLPFYLGDDTTDEDAFRALARRGIGIFVGAPGAATAASWRLVDPAEVGRFLGALSDLLEARDG